MSIEYTKNGQVLLFQSSCPDKHGRTYFIQGLVKAGSEDNPLITEIYGWQCHLQGNSDGGAFDTNYYLPFESRPHLPTTLYGEPMSLAAAQKYAEFLAEYWGLNSNE